MAPTRRRVVLAAAAVTTAGCITDPGRSCPGATMGLSLSPAEEVQRPLTLDSETLSTAGNAVVETAIEGEHVENCVVWESDDGDPGPSEGLREVGERVETHLGIDLAKRREPVETDARRDGEGYRLDLRIAESR